MIKQNVMQSKVFGTFLGMLAHGWASYHSIEHTPLWCLWFNTFIFNTFHYRIYFLNEILIRRQNRGIHMLRTRFIDYSHNLCCLLRCRHFHQIPNIFSRNSKFNQYKHPIFLHISHEMINKNRLKIRKKKSDAICRFELNALDVPFDEIITMFISMYKVRIPLRNAILHYHLARSNW